MKRRDFLKTAGLGLLAGVWSGCGGGALRAERGLASGAGMDGRVLVLVELHGGNDGLNTVVPHRHPRYRHARPGLALEADTLLGLDEDHGLHPALAPMMGIWEAGELAVVQGVGYARPNRSHFRSIEIWETASRADETLSGGWIERTLGARRLDGLAADGVIVGHEEAGPLAGPGLRTISMRRPELFVREARRLERLVADTGNPALDHVLRVQNEVIEAAETIERRLDGAPVLAQSFPGTRLGRQLEVVARLVAARVPLAVLKVRHGSFDTHARQRATHARLLGELAESLAVLRSNLTAVGCWQDVVVMTYSEFGRRVAENGSGGTDHGTAAPQLVLGGHVVGGLHGVPPELDGLDANGDLVHTVDFRSMYNTVAERWWGLEAPFGGHAAQDWLAA